MAPAAPSWFQQLIEEDWSKIDKLDIVCYPFNPLNECMSKITSQRTDSKCSTYQSADWFTSSTTDYSAGVFDYSAAVTNYSATKDEMTPGGLSLHGTPTLRESS
jgi:hypothetical protein